MKIAHALSLMAAAAFASFVPCAWSAPNTPAVAAASTDVSGEVLEIKEVDSYTYLRLKTKDGETWAAVSKAPVKVGAKVTVENSTVMNNFESKSLKKTFPKIVFGTLAGAAGSKPAGATAPAKAEAAEVIKVPKATGANAHTVAEVVTGAAGFKDKQVQVRGKVVKYNEAIMGKNWIHLRDGSGLASNESNDVLVTTTAPTKLGEVVTVTGVVHTNKDLGSGYSYKVLIEEATLKP